MSYMKRDHGNEHDRGGGCLGGENQPNEPASRRELIMEFD